MRGPPVVLALVLLGATAAPSTAASVAPQAPTRAEAWVARITIPTRAYASATPKSRTVAHLATEARWAKGPNQLLILATKRDAHERQWLKVRLHDRPNDAAGWILQDRTTTRRTRWRVELALNARTITVRHNGKVRRRFSAVIGAPNTPTPRGLFAVAERVRQPNPDGFLGPWALHLTSHSNVLDDFGGGPGRVAIHGRGGASFNDPLGSARSHGCIRIDNHQVRFLARVLVPGAPVRVTG